MRDGLPTRILLADDHALVRRGLRLILESEPDFTVVAEAGDGADAVALVRDRDIDLVVLDVAMPRMTSLQAAREMSRRSPALPILMLSMYDNEQYIFEALKAGACGYVLKSDADEDLVAACRAAVRGEPFLCSRALTAQAAPPRTSPRCWSSAARPSNAIEPMTCRSWRCGTARSSPGTRSRRD